MPYVLPTPEPRKRNADYWGELFGAAGDKLFQLLVGGGGRGLSVPRQPTPGNPGTISFPSGASTTTSPLEMAMIRQMGGVPTTTGSTLPLGNAGARYTQPRQVIVPPSLDYLTKQADLQKKQQDLDPNSPMNAYIRSLTTQQSGGQATGITPDKIKQLEDEALAGDEEAAAAYRKLKQLGLI